MLADALAAVLKCIKKLHVGAMLILFDKLRSIRCISYIQILRGVAHRSSVHRKYSTSVVIISLTLSAVVNPAPSIV